MRTSSTRSLRRSAAIALALGIAALMSACIHVPARVWYNGQAMQSSWQYDAFMYGMERNPRTLRGMYYSSDARRLGQPVSPRLQPFGDW